MSDIIHNKPIHNNVTEKNQTGGISMLKLIKKRLKNQKGLTLVEVLAVVVILAIVAMIAIPAIGNIIENNRIKAIKADAVNIISAANLYFTDEGTGTFNKNNMTGYLESVGTFSDDDKWEVVYDTKNKVATFSGTGKSGNVELKFTNATIEQIDAENAHLKKAVDKAGSSTITKNE